MVQLEPAAAPVFQPLRAMGPLGVPGLVAGALSLFILAVYLNRWLAFASAFQPAGIYDNFVEVGVMKLRHGVPLYRSTVAMPSDHIYGPFPVLIAYAISLITPSGFLKAIPEALAIVSLAAYAALAALIWRQGESSVGAPPRVVHATLLAIACAAVVPKAYFQAYHPEQLCYVLAGACAALCVRRCNQPRASVADFALGVVAAAGFLTKANYISLILAVAILYVGLLRLRGRSVLLLGLGFLCAVAAVLPWVDVSGWIWWTVRLPIAKPSLWKQTAGSFLYSDKFAALVIIAMIGLHVSRRWSSPVRSILVTIATLVTLSDLANGFKIGGTLSASSMHASMVWMLPTLAGVVPAVRHLGPWAVCSVVWLGLPTPAPRATDIRTDSVWVQSTLARVIQQYRGATKLTMDNAWEREANVVPEFVGDSLVELERAGIADGAEVVRDRVVRGTGSVVVDDRFNAALADMTAGPQNEPESTLHALRRLFGSEYAVREEHTSRPNGPWIRVYVTNKPGVAGR